MSYGGGVGDVSVRRDRRHLPQRCLLHQQHATTLSRQHRRHSLIPLANVITLMRSRHGRQSKHHLQRLGVSILQLFPRQLTFTITLLLLPQIEVVAPNERGIVLCNVGIVLRG